MFPGTSVDLIDKHYKALGIQYQSNDTLARKQARAEQVATSIGGQSFEYVQGQLNIAYPNLTLIEFFSDGGTYNPKCTVKVNGELQTTTDTQRANDILRRTAPAFINFVFDITVADIDPNAEAGRAVSGLMQAGRESS